MLRFLLIALLAGGCNTDCDFDDDDTTAPCHTHDDRVIVTYHGEAFPVRAVGPAGDRVVALIDHIVYGKYGGETAVPELLELDATGALLSVTVLPALDEPTSVAGDGLGTAVVVHGERASWLRDGVEIGRFTSTDPMTVTYAAGEFWVAIASAPRQLLRYGADGNRREAILLPDERQVPGVPSKPSLAGDAAGWMMSYGTEHAFVVNRRGGADVELGRVRATANDEPWSTTVAMREGTIAMLFGTERGPTTFARLLPDGTIATTPIVLAHLCDELAGTATGYVARCQRAGAPQELVHFDDAGKVIRFEDTRSTHLAAARDAVLEVRNGEGLSLETRVVGSRVDAPALQLFEGRTETRDEEGVDGVNGCSTTKSSSWLGALALLLLRSGRGRRRDSRASRSSRSSSRSDPACRARTTS